LTVITAFPKTHRSFFIASNKATLTSTTFSSKPFNLATLLSAQSSNIPPYHFFIRRFSRLHQLIVWLLEALNKHTNHHSRTRQLFILSSRRVPSKAKLEKLLIDPKS
jgi:hypothetical protein